MFYLITKKTPYGENAGNRKKKCSAIFNIHLKEIFSSFFR